MNSLQSYSRNVFFIGAGMSAESGVPNYDDFWQFLRQMEESKDYLRIEDLKDNYSYKIYARNAKISRYVGREQSNHKWA